MAFIGIWALVSMCDRDRSDRKRSAAGLWRVSVLVCWQPQTELGELTHSPAIAQIASVISSDNGS